MRANSVWWLSGMRFRFRLLVQTGTEVALLSGRSSPAVARRAAELGIAQVMQGIDDKRSARESDRKIANNYVRAALNEATAGKPVTVANTTPYGCSVKY